MGSVNQLYIVNDEFAAKQLQSLDRPLMTGTTRESTIMIAQAQAIFALLSLAL